MLSRAACAVGLAATGAAIAQPSYTFQSPALDNTSFTASFTLPQPFADGAWSFSGATAMPGFSYRVSDGYTTDTALADLQTLSFSSTGGLLSNINLTVVDTASVYDPFYGYTYFAAGVGSTQLQDAANPGIVGVDYLGHHIPVASAGPGVWTLVPSAVAAVPEPSIASFSIVGLCVLAAVRGRRSMAARRASGTPVEPVSTEAVR